MSFLKGVGDYMDDVCDPKLTSFVVAAVEAEGRVKTLSCAKTLTNNFREAKKKLGTWKLTYLSTHGKVFVPPAGESRNLV